MPQPRSKRMRLSRRSAMAATGLGLLEPATAAGQTAGAGTRYDIDKHPADWDDLVLQTLARTGVPGLSIAITNAEKVVYLKGFGVRHVGKSEPVDPDTVFQLASMSKPRLSRRASFEALSPFRQKSRQNDRYSRRTIGTSTVLSLQCESRAAACRHVTTRRGRPRGCRRHSPDRFGKRFRAIP